MNRTVLIGIGIGAAICAAGIDGLERKLVPPPPVNRNATSSHRAREILARSHQTSKMFVASSHSCHASVINTPRTHASVVADAPPESTSATSTGHCLANPLSRDPW